MGKTGTTFRNLKNEEKCKYVIDLGILYYTIPMNLPQL